MTSDNSFSGKQTSPALGPIGQISRTVDNIQTARVWYEQVLGLPHLYSFGALAFFDCNGTRLMLTQNDTSNAAESILYFRVADIVAACEALQAHGVEFVQEPRMIHRHEDGSEEWMAFFNDPQARPLALLSQVNTQMPAQ